MKKIKIVLLGVILVVGFFSQGEKALAQDICEDAKLGVTGECRWICFFGQTEINGEDCKENFEDKTCCTTQEKIDAAKALAEKEAREEKDTGLVKQGCCIKSINPGNSDYGKNSNCYIIDLTKPEQEVTCATNSPLGKVAGETCRFHPAECGVISASDYESDGTSNTVSNNTNTQIPFANPIGIDSVSGLLDSILNNLMGLIVIVAVIFIIIGGIMYMTSAGNEKMVTRAKQTWTGATVGLAIALASPTFLKQIKEILNSNSTTGGTADNWVNKALTIKEIGINILNFLLSVFGVLAIIALVIGGGMYLTAYGDEKKIDSGKKIITYAIIGIVVALSALVVTRQIANLIGVMAK